MRTASDCVPNLSTVEPEEPEEEEDEEESDEEDDALSAVATFARVFAPAMPSAVRPFFFWKFMTAASVLEPKWPLIVPL